MSEKNEWKLVPVEPTPEMWAAVNKLDDEMAAGSYDGKGASIEQVWNCLVDAAPSAPGDTQDEQTESILWWIMRQAQEAKEPCGDDPESLAAVRNAKLASIGGAAAQALGLVRGPDYPAPAAGDALDAARYRWLRDHACNSLHLTRDGEHACNYLTAAQWIESCPEDFQDDAPEEIERMKATNTIWRLQVYPNTPVGFWVLHASTLDAAIDAAQVPQQGEA
ncbi:hypothetical protein [Achromobacter arsenitoxydans]|uniref:Uncharacterized protein n=1 Tax=Achromobacter arsenitoxydans SY8 TaxID=477184 RepID=H0F739_9BURK|nr:hypothetical protein [Achromobacter arsenitoxydans]EHK65953.1 hypothetical protein KYC_12528 [Achromobacter arsenitoxydans SY8]